MFLRINFFFAPFAFLCLAPLREPFAVSRKGVKKEGPKAQSRIS
jgi:hypothetical protein